MKEHGCSMYVVWHVVVSRPKDFPRYFLQLETIVQVARLWLLEYKIISCGAVIKFFYLCLERIQSNDGRGSPHLSRPHPTRATPRGQGSTRIQFVDVIAAARRTRFACLPPSVSDESFSASGPTHFARLFIRLPFFLPVICVLEVGDSIMNQIMNLMKNWWYLVNGGRFTMHYSRWTSQVPYMAWHVPRPECLYVEEVPRQ